MAEISTFVNATSESGFVLTRSVLSSYLATVSAETVPVSTAPLAVSSAASLTSLADLISSRTLIA